MLSYKDYKYNLLADFEAIGMKHPFLAKISFGENWMIYKYERNLRRLEYLGGVRMLYVNFCMQYVC